MKKKIIVQKYVGSTHLTEYFDFNGIPYDSVDLYDTSLDTFGRYDIPELFLDSGPIVLILDRFSFESILDWEISRRNLMNFLRKKNKVIVFQNMDSGINIDCMKKNVLELDSIIDPGAIMYISDCKFPAQHWTNSLSNSLIRTMPYSAFVRIPRLHCLSTEKSPDSHPYMVTTILKKNREHRKFLYAQLKQNTSLYNKGICIFRKSQKDKQIDWKGMAPLLHNWFDDYPSMDLYKNAFTEIVPETLYKNGYFFTEKTAKPIATKTPFLVVSSMGYLDYLRSFGFRTFDSLISERYDSEHRVQDRVRLMLEQLEDIVKNGVNQFYHACSDILDHNQKKLAEITGLWHIETDRFFTRCLLEVDQ